MEVHKEQGRLGGRGFLPEDGRGEFGFGIGGFISDSFNAHVCQGEIEIVEARV